MVAVRMMEVAVDDIVDVIAVGHRFMSAVRAMDMVWIVMVAGVIRCATVRVLVAHRDGMLLNPFVGLMMEVAVVEIIDVPVVFDGRMSAVGSVLVIVVFMM